MRRRSFLRGQYQSEQPLSTEERDSPLLPSNYDLATFENGDQIVFNYTLHNQSLHFSEVNNGLQGVYVETSGDWMNGQPSGNDSGTIVYQLPSETGQVFYGDLHIADETTMREIYLALAEVVAGLVLGTATGASILKNGEITRRDLIKGALSGWLASSAGFFTHLFVGPNAPDSAHTIARQIAKLADIIHFELLTVTLKYRNYLNAYKMQYALRNISSDGPKKIATTFGSAHASLIDTVQMEPAKLLEKLESGILYGHLPDIVVTPETFYSMRVDTKGRTQVYPIPELVNIWNKLIKEKKDMQTQDQNSQEE